MAGSSTIRAGKAVVEVAANLDPLKKGLSQGKSEVQSFGQSLASTGAMISGIWSTIASSAVVAAVASSVKEFAAVGSAINDMSLRTGMAASELQFLSFAAKQTGASMESIETALKAMVRAGFKVENFQALGQSIANIEDPTQRTARALAVFGKSGTALLPMFTQLNDLRRQSAALGPLLTDQDVANADKLGDSFGALAEAFSRLKQQVGAGVAGPATELTQVLIGLNAQLADFAKNTRGGGKEGGLIDMFPAGPTGITLRLLRARGAESTKQAVDQSKTEQMLTDTLKEQAKAAKELEVHQKAVAKQWEDLATKLRAASEKRMSLAREFMTDDERFVAKQKEISAAIAEAKKSLVFIGQANVDREVAALEEAGRRNLRERAAEQGKAFDRIGKELEGVMTVAKTASRGATGAGASLLGRAAPEFGQVEKQQLEEAKRHTGLLQKISDRVGPARFN